MTKRTLFVSTLLATAVSVPALAFAFGGPGGAGGPCGGGPGGFSGPMGGPGGSAPMMTQALAETKLTLGAALTKAQSAVSGGTVVSARLMPFNAATALAFGTPGQGRGQGQGQGQAGAPNSFSSMTPDLDPTYMVTLIDGDTKVLVTVDGETGEAVAAGSATGLLAQGGPGRMGGGYRSSGRMPAPAVLTDATVGPDQAIDTATKAVGKGQAVMVRAMQRGNDTAWVVGVAPPADDTDSAFTMVFVDPTTGEVLNTRTMTRRTGGRPGGFGHHGGHGGFGGSNGWGW